MRFFWSCLVSVASLTGCLGPNDCTQGIQYGLVVTVRDSATGIAAGNGATVVAQDGTYIDTLIFIPTDSLVFQGARERPGTYSIRITKNGYAPWTREGIVVRAGSCHVITVAIEALLQRLSN